MEGLPIPSELSRKIFFLLDRSSEPRYSSTRKWRELALDNVLWCNLFKERWGDAHANFYAPTDSKTWKDVYEVHDRCDRVGLGLKIVREGDDYLLIHQGEIQRHLASRNGREFVNARSKFKRIFEEGSLEEEDQPELSLLDKIFFFISKLEVISELESHQAMQNEPGFCDGSTKP